MNNKDFLIRFLATLGPLGGMPGATTITCFLELPVAYGIYSYMPQKIVYFLLAILFF